jgi:hypothetical protein
MAVQITDALANTILDSGYDAWLNLAIVEGRTGPPPGPGLAPTGTLLFSMVLPADAMAPAAGRSKGKAGTWQVNAIAASSLGHYRVKTAADTGAVTQTELRQEGTITATGGGGDMTVSNLNTVIGGQVTITGFSIAIP